MNIIRPSNAYGPGQAMHRILPRAVLCALTGQKLTLDGGGASRKSYIHAIDLAGAIMAVRVYAEPGRIYNAGPALPISIYDLVAVVADQAGIAMDDLCTVGPARRGEDAQYWLDSSRIAAETGWKPTVALEDGIAGMLDWGRKHLDVLQAEPATFTLRG